MNVGLVGRLEKMGRLTHPTLYFPRVQAYSTSVESLLLDIQMATLC